MLPLISYWEGETPSLIRLCLQSLQKYNPTFHLYDPGSLPYEESLLYERYRELPAPQRSDLIRLSLLKRYGGIWVDADSICLQPLKYLLKLAEGHDLVGVFNEHQGDGDHILATPFGGRPGSPLIEEAYERVRESLDAMLQGISIQYGMTSIGILSRIWKKYKLSAEVDIKRLPYFRWNRIRWDVARERFLAEKDAESHEFSPYYGVNVALYHLTNPIRHHFETWTEERILRSRTLVGFLLSKVKRLAPSGMCWRAYECLKRLPEKTPSIMVEVGVFKGLNAGQILQNNQQVTMRLVDPYGRVPASDDYIATKDPKARIDRKKFQVIEAATHDRLRGFPHRVRFLPWDSAEAATHIENQSVDAVFIDDDHSYSGCLKSIKAWLPKVKPGGWIGGHDYYPARFPGVVRAVDEVFRNPGYSIDLGKDWTWFVEI